MRSFPNIEKGAKRGEYIGYSEGRVFYVRRGYQSGWKAIERDGLHAVYYARTLTALAKLLESLNPQSAEYTRQRYQAFQAWQQNQIGA